MDLEKLPPEVMEAMCISMLKYVGQDMYNRFLEIVKKYPKYFPQEYSYHFVVPEGVHTAYREERDRLYEKFYPPQKEATIYKFEAFTKESLKEMFSSWEQKLQKDKNYQKELKKVWNKHYKKYKIKYEHR